MEVFTLGPKPKKEPLWSFIFAVDKKNGFAKNGQIPWKCPQDLKFFSACTKSGYTATPKQVNAVLMGRKTWDSIPETRRPLKDRINFVLTTKPLPLSSGAFAVNSFEHAEEMIANVTPKIDNVHVIGGVEILKHYLPKYTAGFIVKYPIDFDCDQKFEKLEDFEKEFGHLEVTEMRTDKETVLKVEEWTVEGYPGVVPSVAVCFKLEDTLNFGL
jgi:dihydrofolate reductase